MYPFYSLFCSVKITIKLTPILLFESYKYCRNPLPEVAIKNLTYSYLAVLKVKVWEGKGTEIWPNRGGQNQGPIQQTDCLVFRSLPAKDRKINFSDKEKAADVSIIRLRGKTGKCLEQLWCPFHKYFLGIEINF